MTIHEVSVEKARRTQQSLQRDREHCSADPAFLAAIGSAANRQLRVVRTPTDYALFTISETSHEDPATVVRIGAVGRERLGTTGAFVGSVDTTVTRSHLGDADAQKRGEFVERLVDDGGQRGLIAIAPHGGDIEAHTDQQAERVAARLADHAVSSWLCRGFKRTGASRAWHIRSTDIDPRSFPLLDSVFARGFTHAVAFHGFDEPDILIGGGPATDALKQKIRRAVDRATAGSGIRVRVARPDDEFGGDDPANIVNRLTAGGRNGVQLEQGLDARTNYGIAIADAVADVYRRELEQPIQVIAQPLPGGPDVNQPFR